MIKLVIHGAAGRMGLRLIALAAEDAQLQVVGAVDQPGHAMVGRDVGELAGVGSAGVALSDSLCSDGDVLIDFSVPAATRAMLGACASEAMSMVIGTTGLSARDHAAIDQAAEQIAIMQAPNMSLGVNLLFSLAAQAAQRLGDDYDIEIVETHHRFKQDAPSGTAIGIADAICQATGKSLEQTLVHGRHGGDVPRKRGEIGMHALRSGDLAGRHAASFGTLGEELTLSHVATTRDVFARGALTAAKWLAGKPAGRYQMKDVLGL